MLGANYSGNGMINYRSASELNSAMGRVYGHMGLAVLVSMLVSMFVASSPDLIQFFFTGIMKWVTIFLPLAAIFPITYILRNDPSTLTANLCLHGFAAVMGLSFSTIFVVYQIGSIVSAFMSGAILFGLMSGYGYFTKQSLDSFGKYLLIGLISVIIVSIINIFIGSSMLQMLISAVAVVIFLGLTAYDTQKIRDELAYSSTVSAEVSGALTLYLDFINLFLNLLQLFGNKNED